MFQRILLIVALTIIPGCSPGRGWGVITKSASEAQCPTDIRQMHRWCYGEDSIMHCPCGPDEAFHGYKPTCWRAWDAPAEVWRDSYCPAPLSLEYSDGVIIGTDPVADPVPAMPPVDRQERLPQPPQPHRGARLGQPAVRTASVASDVDADVSDLDDGLRVAHRRLSSASPAPSRRAISERLQTSVSALSQMVDSSVRKARREPSETTRQRRRKAPVVDPAVVRAGTLELPAASQVQGQPVAQATVLSSGRTASGERQTGGRRPISRSSRANSFVR